MDNPQEHGQNNKRKPIGLFNLVTLTKFLICVDINSSCKYQTLNT